MVSKGCIPFNDEFAKLGRCDGVGGGRSVMGITLHIGTKDDTTLGSMDDNPTLRIRCRNGRQLDLQIGS